MWTKPSAETGTTYLRPFSSLRSSVPPFLSASLTAAVTSSTLWLDSNASSRATFWTPILTSTVVPFVGGADGVGDAVDGRGHPHTGARCTTAQSTAAEGRVFHLFALGETADAAPRQLPDDPGRLLAGDLARLSGAPVTSGEPVARRYLGHAGQVRVGVGEVGVAGDDLGQCLAAGESDPLDALGDGRFVGEVGLEDEPEGRALTGD